MVSEIYFRFLTRIQCFHLKNRIYTEITSPTHLFSLVRSDDDHGYNKRFKIKGSNYLSYSSSGSYFREKAKLHGRKTDISTNQWLFVHQRHWLWNYHLRPITLLTTTLKLSWAWGYNVISKSLLSLIPKYAGEYILISAYQICVALTKKL